jgi:RNA polymerase sigma-70 factor (ECF subfamily)
MEKPQFELLFRAHYTRLCNFAQSYVPDLDTAREIVQEVFVNLWNTRDTISPDKSVISYLYTSVKNRCLNWLRDQNKFRSYVLDIELEESYFFTERDLLHESDVNRRIEQALGKLPEKCRQVFEMSRFEELKYKEIAEKLGISVKTVEVQVSKALRILREELKELLMIIIWLL